MGRVVKYHVIVLMPPFELGTIDTARVALQFIEAVAICNAGE